MTDVPKTQSPSQCRRWFPITLSVSVAITSLSLIAAWAATDASFRIATWKARAALRFESIPSASPEMEETLNITSVIRDIHWDALGKRAIVFCILFFAAFVTTVMSGYFAARRITPVRLASILVVLSIWATLYYTLDAIQDSRARRQVLAILPKIEQAVSTIQDRWPTEPQEIAPGIQVYVMPDKYPDVLTILGPRPSYPFHEGLGFLIKRGESGIIRFDLAAAFDSSVEFHPNGTVPSAHSSGFGYPSSPVVSVAKLKHNWYLVRYGGT